MDRKQRTDEQLAALAHHMIARRSAILRAWRESVEGDRELTASSALPRSQFNDHIPALLSAYSRSLSAWPRREGVAAEAQRKEDAANHGQHRWNQGYRLRDVTREWGHLNLCLVNELIDYSMAHRDLEAEVMPTAWRALAKLCSQGVSESTTQYFKFQQAEAAGHVDELRQTLDQVKQLESRRAELFHQAAHDLRGNVGVVKNVSWGLTREAIPETVRDEFLQLLQSSVSSLHSMLDDVMDLARLQAGHELRDVKRFDAAALLRDLYENLRPLAAERRLSLKAAGPGALLVEGDAVKVRRIAQNLLLNALKYTRAGSVTVTWGDSRDGDDKRWMLCVQDTGPGFRAGAGAPLAEALKEATAESQQVDERATEGELESAPAEPDPAGPPAGHAACEDRGEGIGLSIVKRLCELLDAGIELESSPGEGTLFRVLLPRRYDDVRAEAP